jgi:hypothetical protein
MPKNYKILGQSATSATTNTDLYTVPATTQTVISTIMIANRSATYATYRIAIVPSGGSIGTNHYIAFDVSIAASDSTALTLGLSIGAGDKLVVYASNANLTFSAFGSEITA